MHDLSRRDFLKTSAAVAGGLALSHIFWVPPQGGHGCDHGP